MIQPTERLLWCLVGVAGIGALGFAWGPLGAAAPYALAGLCFFAAVDFFLARSPKMVSVERVLPERVVEKKEVQLGLALRSRRRVDVDITDTVPHAVDPWVSYATTVDAGESVTLFAPVTFVKRGRHLARKLAIRTRGPLGLVQRRQRRLLQKEGEGDVFCVSSDLAAVMARAERLVQGQDSAGGRRKRAIERGRELDSLREYRRGDDVRLVDWKASAKRGDLVVKDLVPETRQDVVVIVDAGRQLLGKADDADGVTSGSRFDAALTTGLVLCAAALTKGDRCGMGALQDDVVAWEPPREGKASLKRVADAVADVEAVALEPAYHLLPGFFSVRLKRRALVCIVTDVVDEASARALAQALIGLRGRHLVVVLAVGDPALTRIARGPPDEQLGDLVPLAAQKLIAHRKRALHALEAAGAIVVDAPAPKAPALAVDVYLSLKSAGRL